MTKTVDLAGLPIGTGSAMGAFIRALSLTAVSRYAIIGMSVNNLGIFDKLGANTVQVSDVTLLFTSRAYTINKDIIKMGHCHGDSALGKIYSVSITLAGATSISTDSCKTFYHTSSPASIEFTEPVDLCLTFYICKISGIVSESMASVALSDVCDPENRHGVISTSAIGHRNSSCWTTVDRHKFTEDVTLHFEGDDYDFMDDLNELKDVYMRYALTCSELLGQLG